MTRREIIWLCAVLLAAFVLRCWNVSARPIWFDEAFSWTLVTQFDPLEVIDRTSRDVHPPLYYLILWCWVRVFGESLLAMRMLSAVLGTASVLVAYLLWRAEEFCMGSQARYATTVVPAWFVMGRIAERLPPACVAGVFGIFGAYLACYSALFAAWYFFV